MRRFLIAVTGVLAAAWGEGAFAGVRWDTSASNQLALVKDGAEVWRFRCDAAKSAKPYFDPVCVAGGPSLTWARPPDHAWHYGLWFSWKFLNGVNYWEEKAGEAAGETVWSAPAVETRADGSARIALALGYRPQPTAEPLLKERRTVEVSAPAADGSYSMDWTLVFTAGKEAVKLDRTPLPGEPDGKAWGGYAGLSVRFARAFANVETVASTVGRVPRDPSGRLDVTAAASEQNGFVGGKPYGVALLAHPSNPRAPGDWYPIENPAAPFFYLNAAFLLKSAYVMRPGETLTLRYRVCVHPGRWDAEVLRRAAAAYAVEPVAAAPIRTLLLSGANNHNWQETTPAVKAILAGSPKFAVTVVDKPWEMKPSDLDGCDSVFNNWNTFGKDKREWSAAMKAAFMAWVKKGGGFFVLHAGGSMFYDWDEFQTLTGGAWEKGTFHPHMQSFRVTVADPAHPVTRGLSDFEIFDEPWQKTGNRNPGRRVLLTGVVSKENKGSGESEPFAWTTQLGQGRCFNLVLGHDVGAITNPACKALILRGAEWAATGDVK